MSMTDEGTSPTNQPTARQTPEKTRPGQNGTGQNRTGHAGGGLPGLAAFGQMQGYTPVTGQPHSGDRSDHEQHQQHHEHAGDSAPEQTVPEQDVSLEAETQNYAEQYVQDYQDYDYLHGAQVEPQDSGSGSEFDEGDIAESAAFTSEELHNYMAEQQASFGNTQYEPEAGAYDPGPTLPPDDLSDNASDDAFDDGGRSLQTFEAHYDQHPEIPLGVFEEPGGVQGDQPFFNEHGETGDADFIGGESAAEAADPRERRGRKVLMAASGLFGVLALGGALAFAYKIGGDSDIARADKPPLIQADNSPVKVAPDEPGGKQFAHTNKKIYERLGGSGNAESEEVVKLNPREEDVAAAATAAIGSDAQAGSGTDTGGPRKVKTLTVRPDGTIETPADGNQKVVKAPPAVGATTAADGTISMSFPSQSQASTEGPAQAPEQAGQENASPPPVAPTIPQQTAAAPQQQAAAGEAPSVAAPPPVQKPSVPEAATSAPEPQQTAAAPAAAPATDGSYVVQVAARKNQTDALAAFADIQQKYPQLLQGYRPLIKRADLGDKGIWYRLNVGPVESKQVASALCDQLKSAGMKSCLVRAQ